LNLFSKAFDKALEDIAEDTRSLRFEDHTVNGMRFEEDENKLEREHMVIFAQELRKGIMFHASAAGIKSHFSSPEFSEILLQPNKAHLQTVFNEKLEHFIDSANEILMVEFDVEDIDDLPFDVTPFSINNPPHFDKIGAIPYFQTCFPNWKVELQEALDKLIKGLVAKVYKKLQKAFGRTLADADRNTKSFHVDIGVEFRLQGGNTLLVNTEKAAATLAAFSQLG
jgi:hypothetical protein